MGYPIGDLDRKVERHSGHKLTLWAGHQKDNVLHTRWGALGFHSVLLLKASTNLVGLAKNLLPVLPLFFGTNRYLHSVSLER